MKYKLIAEKYDGSIVEILDESMNKCFLKFKETHRTKGYKIKIVLAETGELTQVIKVTCR